MPLFLFNHFFLSLRFLHLVLSPQSIPIYNPLTKRITHFLHFLHIVVIVFAFPISAFRHIVPSTSIHPYSHQLRTPRNRILTSAVSTSSITPTATSASTTTTPTTSDKYDYDLIVIGGGSGGMACAKKAASLGARVALFDYVKPSTQGTTWGLGGTCVNVGCVPKKIMHYAGLLGQSIYDSKSLGWNIPSQNHDSSQSPMTHNWKTLVESVNNHIHMLNFRYRTNLKKKEVNYINALATFEDPHTVSYKTKAKVPEHKRLTAAHIVIATGGRPYVPSDIPGAKEYAITSDDIFFLDHSPGKTLCVGASYIALECAGFLTELGYDVSVAVRSQLLRGFDRQMAEKIGQTMEDLGTKFLYNFVPKSIEKRSDGRLEVKLVDNKGFETSKIFDTVLFATGRIPDTKGLNLPAAGVMYDLKSSKIPVTNEQTNVANIYAIGDVVQGKQELTPVAIHTGELLAKRLFGNSTKVMDYDLVATTVFTPIEYGSVGLTEEEAIEKYGENDIEVYLSEFTTLEISAVHRSKPKKHQHVDSIYNNSNDVNSHSSDQEEDAEDLGPNCLSKLITVKSLGEKVIGFHFVGPNAGEITQGFALALKLGATKSDFDDLVGIHPTDAESFCALSVTKRSGESFTASGGCGGGVCG